MAGTRVGLLLLAAPVLIGQGCTYRAWYEGFKERERQECYRNASQEEVQKCLDRVNSTTYDDYRRNRTDGKE
ncbi:MAG: hypothetical protein HZB55_12415 [Deltaproteobacteria bacterium]|nr:hypothetical protein [Deltaproteobacteria bacterium]